MGQAILAARSPAEIGRAALGRIRRMVPCQRCSIVLFDFPQAQAQVIAGYAGGTPISTAPIPLDALSPGEVLRRGTMRYVEDLATMEAPPPIFRQLLEDGLRSVLSVPLLADGETIGEVNLASETAGAFDSEHRDIALEVAAPLAIAIQHARLRDDLARKSTEMELRMAERGAALRGATAELETLLYSVSHDLRTPVRHIGGFAELLLRDGGPGIDPAVRHHASRIHEAASRMGGMLDDLVQLNRVGRQDMLRRPVDFNTLVEDVVSLQQSGTEDRLIDWEVEPLPMLECDPALAKAAIANLVSNAVKFTRTRGRASIRIRPVRADDQDGIAVQDNGVGFKMAYAGKLFGLFQRLHRSDEFEGDGAGLAFVQRIAQRHGGRVWAESEVDAGATFYITFGGPDVRHAS
jgi:signal transduction histidine kinase